MCIVWSFYPFPVLLLREAGIGKLHRHGCLYLRIGLAQILHQAAEVHRCHDSECTAATLLSWVRHDHSELGDILRGKLYFISQ